MTLELGNQVITFDTPVSGYSIRPCHLSMQEMHDCANEALNVVIGRSVKVVVVGRSMGGMALLAYVMDYSRGTERLILIGTGSGGPAYMTAPVHCGKQVTLPFYNGNSRHSPHVHSQSCIIKIHDEFHQ